MRIFVIAFAVIAATSAASISSDFLPPVADNSLAPGQEYLAPAPSESDTAVAEDGYRYKTVRKLRLRHRRDVSEIVHKDYLPPNEESPVATEEASDAVVAESPTASVEAPAAVEAPEEKTVLADDGYRYKVVRRIRYRQRRDVNEIPSNDYLPPNKESSEESSEESSASEEAVTVEVPEEKTVLADDGYRYKVVRRIRYRHRRDVNELPANEYLPPNQDPSAASEESSEESASSEESPETVAVEAPEEKTVLADDGYRYKVVRRIRYRHRRDVNELPANEYLPPNQESSATSEEAVVVEIPASSEEASETVAVEAPEEKTVLADDGYRYKVVRRIRYRHRRDVNELPASYLPPNQETSAASEEAVAVEAPIEVAQKEASEAVAVEVPEEKTVLADDGYHYKVVRRIRYRHRRDVNELPASYLPPNQEASASKEVPEAVAVEAPIQVAQEEGSEAVAVEAPEEKTVLADDGYHYKVVRRIRYRHRRDVNELPASYLPPNQETSAASEEAPEAVAVAAPIEAAQEEASEAVAVEAPEEKTVLADDGYHYKVVRRIRYRHRRDVNELPASYLPPNQETSAASEEAPEAVAVAVPIEAAQEETSEAVAVEAPEEKTVLADDGYHYKVVRRIRYRHRRDVNELPANEYLPPNQDSAVASEEVVAVEAPASSEEASKAVAVEAPEEKTVLTDDGYHYKVVRRIRYRRH